MNLRDLQYIIAVADLKNFSRAAEQCHVSQPTLSAQVKKLEVRLGTPLFERTNKRVMLTAFGGKVIESARRILGEWDLITETAETARDPFSGRYRLAAFPTLACYLFPGLVPRIKELLPSTRLVLVEEKSDILLERLRQGKLDAAFLALPIPDEEFHIQALFKDQFYVAASPGHVLAQHHSVDARALTQHDLLLLEEGHCLRDQALEICELMGVADDMDIRATSLETLRNMVRADSGVTLMPEIAIDPDDQSIRSIPFEGEAPFRMIALVRRRTCSRTQVFDRICKAAENWCLSRNLHL
ncbi:MAG: LysR substrate-binding domain-containing protein [Parvularcula sp.]